MFIHDISAEYKHAIGHSPLGGSDIVGDALMGSLLFRTRLSSMEKPQANYSSKAQYFVDTGMDTNHRDSMTLQKGQSGCEDLEAKM